MVAPNPVTGHPSQPGIFARIVRLGAVKGTLVMTLICVGASVVLAVSITAALHRLSLMGFMISLVIPAIIVPTTWYPFFAVSERLRATEIRLRAGEERYRSILESMGEAYVEFDRDGRLAFCNDALGRITGYSRIELAQRRLADFIRPEELRRLRETGRPATLYDFPLTAKDGSVRILEASFSPLPDDGGGWSGHRAVIRDVSERIDREREREALEEQLRRARRMEALGTLAGGVAHDLNNVLSGIVGYPDLLLLDCPAESPLRKPLIAMKESGERAAGIVQDLLTLSRRGVMTTEVLDLNRIVRAYIDSPEHAALARNHPGVRVTAALEPELLPIEGSAVHIAKSVMNLVVNAFEAIPAEGTVALSTGSVYLEEPLTAYDHVKPGDYVTLTVTDSGTGMAPADLERIFEPFYTKKVMGRSGTGLGMAVVWGVVKDHSGYIDIRSEVGRGTVVTLFFPASRRELAVQAAAPPIERYLGSGERILVVDDLPDQRELASRLLERLGYRVRSVASGEEAVANLGAEPADLVLLDMIMGSGMDGLDTCRLMYRMRPGQPVVIASGFSETGRVREALRLGPCAYIKKPYRLETLARIVRETLARGSASAPRTDRSSPS
jgi:PAS domain S-box-containing protein